MALTLIHKIHNAVSKIGTANGTKVTEPEYSGEERSNSAREKWFAEWAVMAEYMVAKAIKQRAEKREADAKSKLETEFGPAIAAIKIGDTNSIVRGNVTITFNRRNAPRRINRQSVINTLSSSDYNWKLDDINKLLDKIDLASPDGALWITPSTTME